MENERRKERDRIYYLKNKDKRKKYYEDNKEKILEKKKKYYEDNKEEINEKDREEYKNNKESENIRSKKYYEKNKDKVIKNKKEYKENNIEKVNNYKIDKEKRGLKIKEYYKKNKDIISEKNKVYYTNNKEKIKEINKKYREDNKDFINNKRNSNPVEKLKHSIRGSISKSIRKNGYTKNSKTIDILGCTYEEFKFHLESKFESWMSWDNYGKYNGKINYGWDFDHIIPLNSVEIEEDIIKLNHYTNLQPLCSYTNRYLKKDIIDFNI